LKASFVPPRPVRQLRNLTRYRKTQIQERSREVNRLHKALEDVADGRLHAVRGGRARRKKEHGRKGANDSEDENEPLHSNLL
jgi:hypothetical protein